VDSWDEEDRIELYAPASKVTRGRDALGVLDCPPMKTLRWLLNRVRALNPLAVAGFASASMLVLVALAVNETLRRILDPLPDWLGKLLAVILFLVILALPAVAMIAAAAGYRRAHLGLGRLIYAFLALVLLFADAYFVTVVMDDRGGTPCSTSSTAKCAFDNDIPLKGVHPVWQWRAEGRKRRLSVERIALAYVDCFHYSIVTGSTVGYGDVIPARWYAKLMADLQILLSLGLTVLGVSRVFASRGSI
jgi:Ion channel